VRGAEADVIVGKGYGPRTALRRQRRPASKSSGASVKSGPETRRMVNIESTLGRGAEQSEKDQEVCGKLSLNCTYVSPNEKVFRNTLYPFYDTYPIVGLVLRNHLKVHVVVESDCQIARTRLSSIT
jgi:hypothetical protein